MIARTTQRLRGVRTLVIAIALTALPLLIAACQQQGGGNTGY